MRGFLPALSGLLLLVTPGQTPAFLPQTPLAASTTPAPAAKPQAALTPVGNHKTLRMAFYQGPGAALDATKSLAFKAFQKNPNLAVKIVSPEDIRAGKLADFDVLVQSGGSGGGQGKALEEEGRERIRTFVKGGGGYIGICAGSYLASCDYPWSLNIINAHVLDKKHWARGTGPVDVAFTPQGQQQLSVAGDNLTIQYGQGPLLAPAEDTKLPPYEPWAKYEGEIALKGAPKGVMPGTTAVAAAPYGSGRVVCFSPHPEKTAGQESLLHRAVLWATRTAPTPTPDTTKPAR
ncbi:MAG: BPL-N domain-containing protein [Armatimonadota bacterium]